MHCIDLLADELGMDPAAIRRLNFLPPDAFPYDNPSGLGTAAGGAKVYIDSGNYEPALDKALKMAGYHDIAKAKAEARTRGKYLGIGLSSYLEICGVAPSKWIGAVGEGWGAAMWESANVKVHLTGKVIITVGTQPQGQGHETTYAQIVAHELGIPMDDVIVQHSDTQGTPFGYGSYGSRTSSVGSSAAIKATDKIKKKAAKIAAHMLEAAPDDIVYEAGKLFVRGSPDRVKTIQEVAWAADLGLRPPVGDRALPRRDGLLRHPQLHVPVRDPHRDRRGRRGDRFRGPEALRGGRRRRQEDQPDDRRRPAPRRHCPGVGQALWEGAVYSDEGQLLTGSMQDYALPRASWLPNFELDETVTPSPVNVLGVKGVGEAGAIASTAAVANAVIDALSPLGIRHIDMPLSAPTVWKAMHASEVRS